MASKIPSKKDYVETDFQKAIRKLTFKEFCNKTNIFEIVKDGYRKVAAKKNIHFAVISAEQLNDYSKHFYDRLYKVHAWQRSDLNNLKWKTTVAHSPVQVVAEPKLAGKVAAIADTVGHIKNRRPKLELVEKQVIHLLETFTEFGYVCMRYFFVFRFRIIMLARKIEKNQRTVVSTTKNA